MSRIRPASGASISLFPFLAVLLCTMGALLVLLVLFSRSAKDSERAADRALTFDTMHLPKRLRSSPRTTRIDADTPSLSVRLAQAIESKHPAR